MQSLAIQQLVDRSTRVNSWVRRGFAIGFAVQIALLAIGLWSVNANRTHTPVFVKPVEASVAIFPIAPESGLPIANAYANQWSDQSRLVAVTMRLEWPTGGEVTPPTELPRRGWIIYVFVDGSESLSLYLDRGTGVLIGRNETAFGSVDWRSLDLATYPKSSTIATLTANIISGDRYQAACLDNRTFALVTASSTHSGDPQQREHNPIWSVTYGDSQFPGTFDVLVQLNAVSGEVVVNRVRDRSCER